MTTWSSRDEDAVGSQGCFCYSGARVGTSVPGVIEEEHVRLGTEEEARQYRQSWLKERLKAPVALTWTNNRTTMVTVRGSRAGGYRLRMQRLFHQAPDLVWNALVAYICGTDTLASGILRTYLQHHQHQLRHRLSRQPLSPWLQPQGRYFDLAAIYRTLNHTFFANQIEATITWMRHTTKRPCTSIRFGSYHPDQRVIRVHRALDQPFVPPYVVEHVVFHEMLHQLIPRQRLNGRWSIHPPAFRQQERRFPAYQQAQAWQRKHLKRLLHSAHAQGEAGYIRRPEAAL